MNTQRNAVWVGLSAGLLLGAASQGAIYSSGALNEVIPDYNSTTSTPGEWADSITVGDLTGLEIADVTLTLNVSGGWNGDLYAYLSYTPVTGSGSLITLMNRPGYPANTYGYGDAGFNGTILSDAGTGNVQNYGGNGGAALGAVAYKPNDGSTTFASAFGGKDANGTWTLYFSDLEAGSDSTVLSWSLNLDVIPEPTHIALGIFGGVLALGGLVRSGRLRGWLNRPTAS